MSAFILAFERSVYAMKIRPVFMVHPHPQDSYRA